ncbi:GIN domain-containing protein [Photobacterium lucens]|uniref:GIN domain-containing protein n=1 Tax=Photobacterium lucens TaxID=2562949 RepID=UPI00136BB1EE|nr:DUF2807 domain-containing protein [Photobacterium lucens]MBP2701066.1 hypothetical protein [Vibrio parahaemolyticus]MZG56275.1 hypothetical protein [Photobacterium lucens]MZG82807.1 hypothetical protein [Photobacterium lucens]
MKRLKSLILLCCFCSTNASATNIYLKQFNEIDSNINNLTVNVSCGKLPSISFEGDELENVKLQVYNATLKLYSATEENPKTNIVANVTVAKPLVKMLIENHANVDIDDCAIDSTRFTASLVEKSYAELHGSTTNLDITLTDNAHAKVNVVAENMTVTAFQSSSVDAKKALGKLNLSLMTDSLFELSARVNQIELDMKERSIATMCNTAKSTINGVMEDDSSIVVNKEAETKITTNDNSKINFCYED